MSQRLSSSISSSLRLSNFRTLSIAAAIVAVGLTSSARAAVGDYEFNILHRTGDNLLGATLTYVERDDYSLSLNNSGEYIFLSYEAGPQNSPFGPSSLYRGNVYGGPVTRITRDAVGPQGFPVRAVAQDTPQLNDRGTVMWGRYLDDAPFGINLFRNGQLYRGPGQTVDGRLVHNVEGNSVTLNNQDNITWVGRLDTVDGPDALFYNDRFIVKEGDTFAGLKIDYFSQNAMFRHNAAGDIVFQARIEGPEGAPKNAVFLRRANGAQVLLARDGQIIPGTESPIDYTDEETPRINDAGTIVYGTRIEDGSQFGNNIIVRDGKKYLAAGDKIDGQTISRLYPGDSLTLNELGQMAFIGVYNDGSEFGRNFLATSDDGMILRSGDLVGGLPVVSLPSEAIDMNDRGEMLFGVALGDLENPTYALVHATPTTPSWGTAAGGNWTTAANWQRAVPNGVGQTARFLGAINQPRTIDLNTSVTLGRMIFDNESRYTISGGSLLTLATAGGLPVGPEISVRKGSHTVAAPMHLMQTTNAVVAAGSTLTLSGGISSSASAGLVKSGAGTLAMRKFVGNSLSVEAGQVRLLADGTANGTMRVQQLTIANGAQLDLADNALVINYETINGQTPLSFVRNLIVSGRNDGAWDGDGLTSGVAASLAGYGVGFGEAATLGNVPAVFGTVDSTAILVRFARYGDATLDGRVNFSDLVALAQNYNQSVSDWARGDFDYNGVVNFSDLVALARNYNQTSAGTLASGEFAPDFQTDMALAFAMVPEPAMVMTMLSGVALLGRRRR